MSLEVGLYRTSLQKGLDLYSGSFATLKNTLKEIADSKKIWSEPIPEELKDESEKMKLYSQHLGSYHKFIETAKFSDEIVKSLQIIYTECNDSAIFEETYKKLGRLGENAEAIRKKEETVVTVNQLIQSLAKRVDSEFKKVIEQAIYESKAPLNLTLTSLNPGAAYNEFLTPTGWTTRTLDNGYPKWLETATDEQKNRKSEVQMNVQASRSLNADDFKLDAIMRTLDLTYIDPETGFNYGALSVPPSSESESDLLTGDPFLEIEDIKPSSVKMELKPSELD